MALDTRWRWRGPIALRAASAAALLLVGLAAEAGVTLKVVSAGRKATYEFEGNRLRLEEEGRPTVVVFDGDAGRYLELHPADRTYAEATQAQAAVAARRFDAELRQRLAAADPEQLRAWVEQRQRVRRRLDALKETRFARSGNQSMIADQMCDGFDELVSGEVVAWGCYAPWSKKSFRKEDFAAVTRLAEFLNAALGQVEGLQGLDVRDGPLGRLARAPGLPLFRLEMRDAGRSAVPMRVTEISRQPIPADRFLPPPGYTALRDPPALAVPVKAALPLDAAREPARGGTAPGR
jgi:hypothetical protein